MWEAAFSVHLWLQKLLICGFSNMTFMTELVKALDSQLPPGSSLTLFSQHVTPKLVGGHLEECESWSLDLHVCPNQRQGWVQYQAAFCGHCFLTRSCTSQDRVGLLPSLRVCTRQPPLALKPLVLTRSS